MKDEEHAHRDAHFQEQLESLKASVARIASLLEQALKNISSEGPSNRHVIQVTTLLKERVGEQGQDPQYNLVFIQSTTSTLILPAVDAFSNDYDLWLSIANGLHRPFKIKDGFKIPKARNEYNNNYKKLLLMDVKAMTTLYCALNRSGFNIIISCKNTKDIWHASQVPHEENNQVKESKIDTLVHQYELFKMHYSEFITSMFTRMTLITNNLDASWQDLY